MKKQTTTTRTKMTFFEILDDETGRELVEALEHGCSDQAIESDLRKRLRQKFGWRWVTGTGFKAQVRFKRRRQNKQ